MTIRYELDEERTLKLKSLARDRGVTIEVVAQGLFEQALDQIPASSEGAEHPVEFHSLEDAESQDWSDDPGPDSYLYRLQRETFGALE